MHDMAIHWKTSKILEAHSITGYQFWKTSGLPKRSAYRVVNGDAHNVNAATLDATIRALRTLTGEPLNVADLLEYREGEEA